MFSGPFSSTGAPGSAPVSGLLNLLYGASPQFKMESDRVSGMIDQSRANRPLPQSIPQNFAPMIYTDYAPMNYAAPEQTPFMNHIQKFASMNPLSNGGSFDFSKVGGFDFSKVAGLLGR
jgi:hypothetical protein